MSKMNPDPRVLVPTLHKDSRGCFFESYNERLANKIGNPDFVQTNTSVSKKGVVRGLHYQWDEPCGKLVRCVKGRIVDVIVNIKKGSHEYGTVKYFNLNEKNKKSLWVPVGYAHGFVSLSEQSTVCYMVTAKWNPSGEATTNLHDARLKIDWKIDGKDLIISDRDLGGISFDEYGDEPRFK